MSVTVRVPFFGLDGLPIAGLHPSLSAYLVAGTAGSAPAVTETPAVVGWYEFTVPSADVEAGFSYTIDGGALALNRFDTDTFPPAPLAPDPVTPPPSTWSPTDLSTWTAADVTALRAACASGVLTVVYDGPPRREITYQSLGAMRALLSEMIRQLRGSRSYRLAAFRKGV